MGTHPIFESDFDCLTDVMNRLIRFQRLKNISSRTISYFRDDVDEHGRLLKQKIPKEIDHYDVLGVARYSTQDEIKRKYRHLVKQYHPDSSTGGNEEAFILVQAAFEILSDPKKKAEYDENRRKIESDRIKLNEVTEKEENEIRISDKMKNISLNETVPEHISTSKLVLGMKSPKLKPTVFSKTIPILLLSGIAGYTSITQYGCMSETFDLLELMYLNNESLFTNQTNSKYDQFMLFLSPRHVIPTLAIIKWIGLSLTYLTMAFHHLNFPDFIAYSIVYDEKSDRLSMLVGDTSTVWKCFRPAPFYITIQNPSQTDFDFDFDEVVHGPFANLKTISFELPVENHNFGWQFTRGRFVRSRQTNLEYKMLANHIKIHIPHFLEWHDTSLAQRSKITTF